ncbi:MAG TPA: TonB family protein [Bryobacteraceae bacterium]|nr:TonB family protein [Bryobacteraceae bacterium]
MSGRVDTLEQHDGLSKFFAFSTGVHVLFFASIAIYASLGAHGGLQWGNPQSLGGAVAVNAVKQIPLPGRSGETNPLANETHSRVPLPPKPVAKPEPKEPEIDPDALPLPARNAPRKPTYTRTQQYSPYRATPDRPNQLYSHSGQAMTSPMYGAQTGSGGTVQGNAGAFGYRFGAYRDMIEQRVAQKWRTDEIDPRITTAPTAIVTFDIQKSGSVTNVRILQSSGNRALDYSAQRAIYEAGPFPPLPQAYERSSAGIEIWFTLKR